MFTFKEITTSAPIVNLPVKLGVDFSVFYSSQNDQKFQSIIYYILDKLPFKKLNSIYNFCVNGFKPNKVFPIFEN